MFFYKFPGFFIPLEVLYNYKCMYYYLTDKFTLIPDIFFSAKEGEEALRESQIVEYDDIIKDCHIKPLQAHLVYALPEQLLYKTNDSTIYPFAAYLLERLQEIQEYNKVIFHYSPGRNLAHVVIAKGDNLQLVNAYGAEGFESACYFLFLAVKQTIVNPLQTKLQVYSHLSSEDKQTLGMYFQAVNICQIDSKTELL